MTTLWMCPCLRPHMVVLTDVPVQERFKGYCDWSRQSIELVFLCIEDKTPREYLPKRSWIGREDVA